MANTAACCQSSRNSTNQRCDTSKKIETRVPNSFQGKKDQEEKQQRQSEMNEVERKKEKEL